MLLHTCLELLGSDTTLGDGNERVTELHALRVLVLRGHAVVFEPRVPDLVLDRATVQPCRHVVVRRVLELHVLGDVLAELVEVLRDCVEVGVNQLQLIERDLAINVQAGLHSVAVEQQAFHAHQRHVPHTPSNEHSVLPVERLASVLDVAFRPDEVLHQQRLVDL